jgi:nicotinate phosphoribosyltransferase
VDVIHQDYLLGFSFSGTVFGYDEGELYLANSPLLRVEATFGEGVVLETLVLSILNHDTAIASTAAQMFQAADGRRLIEMGSRRTHDESAVHAARAAYIGGFDATSNLEAGYRYAIPTAGTAAHAWILSHDTEYDAFVAQIRSQGVGTTLLVDTYNSIEGIVNAVEAAKLFGAAGPGAIRIDSGDLLDQSFAGRDLLDSLGATDTKIVATGDLDEERIGALTAANAPVDSFGVGTNLVTGANCPSPGFVYKLVAIALEDGTISSVAKRSPSKQDVGGTTYVRRMSVEQAQGLGLVVAHGPTIVEVLFKEDPKERQNATWSQPQRALVVEGTANQDVTSLKSVRAKTMRRITSRTQMVQLRHP